MSQEYLEAMLAAYVRDGISMRGVVDAIADILAGQDHYRKEIPLVGMALAIRTVYARSTLPLLEAQPGADTHLLAGEIATTVRLSASRVRARMEGSYVAKGKTDIATYSTYYEVITDLLLDRYAGSNGDGVSLFTRLAERTPGLTIEEYRQHHRAILEYLFRLSEREFLDSMKTRL